MRITEIRRYPVKSMLGERVERSRIGPAGLDHDRGLALVDAQTGLVATAKHPRLWRSLLRYRASVQGDGVHISAPDGWTRGVPDGELDELLSRALGREVRLVDRRPDQASVERPDPEDVIEHGVAAEVPAATLQIGQGTPGHNFVDYAPVHVITTATLDAVGVEPVRYRPNLVIETPPGTEPFVENSWVSRELHVSGAVLRVALPTPRCAVPTLEHGELPRAVHAVRALLTANRVEVPGFGVLPCAGGYADVLREGAVQVGDEVTLH
jgi:uncharacterized protein